MANTNKAGRVLKDVSQDAATPTATETETDFTVSPYEGLTLSWNDLPFHARRYYAEYGVRQAIADANASTRGDILGTKKRPALPLSDLQELAKETGYSGPVSSPMPAADGEAFVNHVVAFRQREKHDAIMNGTVGSRGPRLHSEEKIRYDFAEEWLKVRGHTFPTKVSEKRAKIDTFLKNEKFAAIVAKETAEILARQKALQSAAAETEIDFDDVAA